MNRLLYTLWTTAPVNIWERAQARVRKLFGKNSWAWDYSLNWVLKSQKHMNPKNNLELWERYLRVLVASNHKDLRQEISFENKAVLELGAGPLLGFGPIALFHGAKRFFYLEPGIVKAVVCSKEVKTRYFVPMYEELIANYGSKMGFDTWYERITQEALPANIEELSGIDLLLSNSVLEHIPKSELHSVLGKLNRLCAPAAWFLHAIDFGPHGTSDSLQSFYETINRESVTNRSIINFLRFSEVEAAIRKAQFNIMAKVVYKRDKIYKQSVHTSWNSYPLEDLSVRVALIVGRTGDSMDDFD